MSISLVNDTIISTVKKILLFLLWLIITTLVSLIYIIGYNIQHIEVHTIALGYWMGFSLMQLFIINIFTISYALYPIDILVANIYIYYSLIIFIIYCIYFKNTIDIFITLHIVQKILIVANYFIASFQWIVLAAIIITFLVDKCIERLVLR
jgi:hypothetical protein